MPEQIQKQKVDSTSKTVDDAKEPELKAKDQQPLTDAVEEILDEIDGVLEENAEEFVAAYVQKGGE